MAISFKSALNRHPFFSFHAPHPLGAILQTCVVASQVAVSALGSSEREAPEVPPILRGNFKATENQWLGWGLILFISKRLFGLYRGFILTVNYRVSY